MTTLLTRAIATPMLRRLVSGSRTALLAVACLAGAIAPVRAQIVQNHAVASASGAALDTTRARVTLRRVASSTAASVAEVSPNDVAAGAPAARFDLDLVAALPSGVSAIDSVQIVLPAGAAGAAVRNVDVNGAALAAVAGVPGPGQYAAHASGTVVWIAFGAPLAANPTHVHVALQMDAPAALGRYAFASTVANAAGAQASTAGNADGDAADANSLGLRVHTAVDGVRSTVTASPAVVLADGVAASTLTVTLRDAQGAPLAGRAVQFASDRAAADVLVQPAAPTDARGVATGTIRSVLPGASNVNVALPADSVSLPAGVQVAFTQGMALRIDKRANRDAVTLGDVVTYTVTIASTSARAVTGVRLADTPPLAFRFLRGSATLDGAPLADPAAGRSVVFDLGTVPAMADANGNGVADPGEAGFETLRYSMVVGSSATPGTYANVALARDACESCAISNTATASVNVVVEPVFSLGTIVGRVYEDRDGNGLQGRDEPGVAGARVALDDGTLAITDRQGLYHFPAVSPGHRLIKLDVGSVGGRARASTSESQFLTVTSGLLAKANFGVTIVRDTVTLGRAGVTGVRVSGAPPQDTLDVRGNVADGSVLLNGSAITLRGSDARMSASGVDEHVVVTGGRLEQPITFHLDAGHPETVAAWQLAVHNRTGRLLKLFVGAGAPPASITWDGRLDGDSLLAAGTTCRYQFSVVGTDGVRASSPERAFGVEGRDLVAISIRGSAFFTGQSELRPGVRETLHGVAEKLRHYPDEKISIDGHTDDVGTRESNRALSISRAQAAADYLVNVEKIARERIELHGWGPDRPVASNATALGREQNRRVELRSQGTDRTEARLDEYARSAPVVAIDDSAAVPDADGRFGRRLPAGASREVAVRLTDEHGRASEARVPLPSLAIESPQGDVNVAYGSVLDGEHAPSPAAAGVRADRPGTIATCRFAGRTDPGNVVELDGVRLPVDADGRFTTALSLEDGLNVFGLVVRNAQGIRRLVTLPVRVADRDSAGHVFAIVDPVPALRVQLPPQDGALPGNAYGVRGVTDRGDVVTVNGAPVPVGADGAFEATVTLPPGTSRVVIQATDSLGHVARVEREAVVDANRLFLVALADGAIGRLQGHGVLRDAVHGGEHAYYTEGRVAYYLKGVVRGRYLVTSAYDSGLNEFAPFFDRVDGAGNDALLTNLDPDRFYPVYGDSSVTIYDAPRRGRFYLGIDSDELKATVGTVVASLGDGELANVQRTVSGAEVHLQSVARSRDGDANTQVTLVGADVRLAHVRDELRGTGGSLYYLSHRDVVQGGEQVSLAVRDRVTGLVRLRTPQRPGVDYTIDDAQGRLLFTRPVSSVADNASIVARDPLAGDPVVIEVEYETRDDGSSRTLTGAHGRQQLGAHVAVGGTWVRDEQPAQPYEVRGVDAELRAGKGSRLTGELASSEGAGERAYVSDDGGLSFSESTPVGALDGHAWRSAMELDAGEWFGRPGALRLRGYFKQVEAGFVSSRNLGDRGTRKGGAGAEADLGRAGRVVLRLDEEQRADSLGTSWNAGRSQLFGAQWQRDMGRWGLGAELQTRHAEDAAGRTLDSAGVAALRVSGPLADRLIAKLERQQGLHDAADDRTTLGFQWTPIARLSVQGQGSHGTFGNSAQGRAAWSVGRGSVYVDERASGERTGAGTTTVFGTQVPIGPGSRVYSEYQWQGAAGERRDNVLVGAQKQWQPGEGLVLAVGGEHGESDASPQRTRRTALTTSATLATPAGLRATTQDEVRFEKGGQDRVQTLTSTQVEAKLPAGLTALAKYRWSETRDRALDRVEARFEEHGVGLALRPVSGDGPNALARWTRQADLGPAGESGAVTGGGRTLDVLSLEGTQDVTRRIDWTGKTALRVMTDASRDSMTFRTHSVLFVSHLNAALCGPFGIGVEYRWLGQREASDHRSGWLDEFTWDAARHVRVGAGFNFADFSDNEFSRNDSSVRGWFLRLQGRY